MLAAKATVGLIAACLIAGAALAAHSARPDAGAQAPAREPAKLRVGTFDSRAVAIAAVRGGLGKRQVNELRAERDKAQKAGDAKKVAELEKRGATLQSLRHLQGFSNAPIDDLLVDAADRLSGVAREAHVDLLVSHVAYRVEGAETVDVTDAMVAIFSPDEATLKIVAELRKQKPAPMLDILLHAD